MKSRSIELRAFLYIRKARFTKKLKIYKQVAAVVFDWTSFFYLAALLGYIGVSMFVTGDIMHEFAPYFALLEENAGRGYALLLSVLPIRYALQSFRHPGVLYSTSEFQLGLLPFSRGRIWVFLMAEKMAKLLLILTLIGMLLILITPIPSGLIISYLALFAIYELVMTVPKWKLFQQRFWMKTGWLLLAIFGCLGASLLKLGLIVLVVIVLSHIVLIPRIFKEVKWEKVTDISDR